YKRIIVFPYFLFTGVLVKRIYRVTDQMAERHPEIEFLKASYLNDHPFVLDCFAERVEEILIGQNNMNCGLCKYREQVLGFEAEVGLPQQSHHHHVEGIGTNKDAPNGASQGGSLLPLKPVADHHHHGDGHHHDHGHSHAQDHGHDHGHAHVPHPHANHRHGPQRRNPEALD
ncbi:MAG: CbiX/SirB N-terminal domain-containing protein, partial [Hypericibacter sp.]